MSYGEGLCPSLHRYFGQGDKAVRSIEFDAVELDRYEDRPGTVSSAMKDQIPAETIESRIEQISKYC